MKELTNHIKENIKLEAQKEQQKEKKHVLLGKIKPKKGQKIYEINEETGEIKEAEFVSKTINFIQAAKKDFSLKKELVIKPDCVYIPALNTENAKKKYLKNNQQDFYYEKGDYFDINEVYKNNKIYF